MKYVAVLFSSRSNSLHLRAEDAFVHVAVLFSSRSNSNGSNPRWIPVEVELLSSFHRGLTHLKAVIQGGYQVAVLFSSRSNFMQEKQYRHKRVVAVLFSSRSNTIANNETEEFKSVAVLFSSRSNSVIPILR